MRSYELLFVVAGDKTEQEAAKVADAVGAVLLELGGKAKEQNPLGRRKLAYDIAKQDHGWYTLLHCELPADQVNELTRRLNVMDEIVRTVLLAAEEVPEPGQVTQVTTAVEESKEAAKVKVPEEMRKTAKPSVKPAAKQDTPADTDKDAGTTERKPAKKAATKQELEAALEAQLKDQED
ncbi:MAG: 30S ribosomal protein S6 [Patescibacteria group bacterium]